jgi:hypothetical protein
MSDKPPGSDDMWFKPRPGMQCDPVLERHLSAATRKDWMPNFTQVAAVLDKWFQTHALNPLAHTVVLRCETPMDEHRLRCALLADFDDMNFGFRRAECADTSKIEVHGIKFEITQRSSSWQPIETAPLDRWILVWCASSLPRMVAWQKLPADAAGYWVEHRQKLNVTPTHWRSLPEPPPSET